MAKKNLETYMNLTFLYPPALILISIVLMIYFLEWKHKPRLHCYPNQEWFNIDIDYLPLKDDYNTFLITDGNNVDLTKAFLIQCDRFGKPYYNKFNKTYITHWAPIPVPPKK